MANITELLIPLWLLACAASDWRSRRVPNALTFGFLLAAAASLLLQGETLSGMAWQSGLYGFAMAGLLTLPGFVLNRLGGGDVKLLMGLGLATDPLTVMVTFIVGTLVLVVGVIGQSLMNPEAELAGREWPFVPGLLLGYLAALFALPYYVAM